MIEDETSIIVTDSLNAIRVMLKVEVTHLGGKTCLAVDLHHIVTIESIDLYSIGEHGLVGSEVLGTIITAKLCQPLEFVSSWIYDVAVVGLYTILIAKSNRIVNTRHRVVAANVRDVAGTIGYTYTHRISNIPITDIPSHIIHAGICASSITEIWAIGIIDISGKIAIRSHLGMSIYRVYHRKFDTEWLNIKAHHTSESLEVTPLVNYRGGINTSTLIIANP